MIYEGEHISGSPFPLKVFDPSLVRVYGLEGGAVGRALTFNGEWYHCTLFSEHAFVLLCLV